MDLIKNALVAGVAAAALAGASVASAAVVGGGATLSQPLFEDLVVYNPSYGWDYAGTGSGTGKKAFFGNDATHFNAVRQQNGLPPYAAGTAVKYAGSDSVVSVAEANGFATDLEPTVGKLIQVPLAATSVTVPFNVPGLSSLNLTSAQLVSIFKGEITNWNQLDSSYPDLALKVVYRTGGSGTTEIFVRHLNAVDSAKFPVVTNDFQSTIDPSNPVFVQATGSGGVAGSVQATPGAIGYVSPDPIYIDVNDASQVAALQNPNDGQFYLPTEVNVVKTVGSVTPPAGAARLQATNWGKTFANPTEGYSIAGFTFLLANECYADPSEASSIRAFFQDHYTGNHDADISAHALIPLAANWNSAVMATYINSGAPAEINGAGCSTKAGR